MQRKDVQMTTSIVGSWRTTVTIDGAHHLNLTAFSSDGVVLNVLPSPLAAPPGSAHRLEFFTTAFGSWKEVQPGKVELAFETLGVDENGNAIGSHAISATVTVASEGASFSGTFTVAILDPAGNQAASISGTVDAARIAP